MSKITRSNGRIRHIAKFIRKLFHFNNVHTVIVAFNRGLTALPSNFTT